ncbi:MAG: ParA family protein [Myxococcota bacterium]
MSIRERINARLKKRSGSEISEGDLQARVLSIASNKGGVGKTTTAVHLSLAIAQRGARVLLVDLDPQAHICASLGMERPAGVAGLADVLTGKRSDLIEATFPSGYPRLTLAGSEKDLAETEAVISAKIGKELLLSGALRIAATHFDLIVFDCPPNLGTLTLNALCASQALLVPSDMSVLALEGVGDILETVETLRRRLDRRIDVLGILATRYDRRTKSVNAEIEASLSDLYGRPLQTRIPLSSSVPKAQMAGQPLFDFDRRSPAAIAYRDLANELMERVGLHAQVGAPVQVAVPG